ncbi:LamG-like jellyroll fold domain-containing protein [Streptomyces sp. NPDC003006]
MEFHRRIAQSVICVMILSASFWGTSSSASAAPLPEVRNPALKEKAFFGLDEGSGSRHVSGGVPEEFAASLSGGARLGVGGKVGTALHLDGSSGYAATPGPVVDTTKSFSVSAWVKLDDKNENYTVLSQAGDHASGFQLYYSKHYDKWVFNRHASDTDGTDIVRSMSNSVAKVDAWTQLVGSYDASDQKLSLFVNGKQQQSEKFATPWRANGALQIGRLLYRGAWQEHTHGLVDEVRAVQSPVTEADVTKLADGDVSSHLQELASFLLDENPGSTKVSGGKGAGPVATLAGRGARLGVGGKVGTALHLDGSSGYAATPGPVVDTTKSFSVSAWVKLDDKNENYTVLSQTGDHASGFQLYYSKHYDKWVFNRHASDTDGTDIVRSMSDNAAKVGEWTHLTGVYDHTAKKVQLLVGGEPQTAASFTTPWQARSALQIGRLFHKGAWQEHFSGTVDDIRISAYDSAAQCLRTHAIGHRGAPEIAPENTLASLEAAVDSGAEWVETDVQFTKDEKPVIMHDATVDRTTNGTGRVDHFTAAEIAQLVVKGGGGVPTLEQVLASPKVRSVRLLLEIKGPQKAEYVDRALRLVGEAGMTENTLSQSFDEDVVQSVAVSPYKTRVALLRSRMDADPVAVARALSLDAYAVKFSELSTQPSVVGKLQAAGIDVFIWTADTSSEWQSATAWGVDGVITNRADQYLRWRESYCSEQAAPRRSTSDQ